MNAQRINALGAIAVILGCLSPFAHLPFVGSITYVLNGKGDGVFVVVGGLTALVASVLRWYIVPVVIACLTGFLLFRFQGVMEHATAQMHASASSAGMFSGLANAMGSAVYLEWGFYVVAVGTLGMAIGGVGGLAQRAGR